MSGTVQRPGGKLDSDLEEDEFPEPPRLKLLRRLVTGLMVVMGLGMVIIVGTVVWRLGINPPQGTPPALLTADAVALPEGFTVEALGGDGAHVLVFGRDAAGTERLLRIRKSDGAVTGNAAVERR